MKLDPPLRMCAVYHPSTLPYRCTRPLIHRGGHEAYQDGQLLATWPRRTGGPWWTR